MKLTKNFYLSEFEASSKAKELGIDNTMPRTPFMLHNAKALAERLQLIRDALTRHYGKDTKLFASSAYRCDQLNTLVGGVDTSQHKLCLAADIYTPAWTASDLFDFIVSLDISFDQLIIEKSGGKEWVHISVYASERKEVLEYNGATYSKRK